MIIISTQYDNATPIVNKTLNADGSITTFQGEIPASPSIQWKNAQPIPNKTLEPDGSIGEFSFSGGGGSGDFPEAPNTGLVYGRKNRSWVQAVENATYLENLGKIKLNETDSIGLLIDKLDSSTLTVDGYNKLKAIGLDGLSVNVTTLNHMLGVTENVQTQLDNLNTTVGLLNGNNVLSVMQNYEDLDDIASPEGGDIAIVREDENHSDSPTLYVFITFWEYIGNLNPSNVESANRLATTRNFTISGDGTTPVNSFDGSTNVNLDLTLNNVVTAGTHPKVTYNNKGLVIGGNDLSVGDIPDLTLAKISNAGTAASINVGVESGEIPILDENGKLPTSTIPSVALGDVYVVESASEMLALPAEQGDIAIRNDIRLNYILKEAPATELGNWVELLVPADTVSSVNGQTGAVALTTITGNAGSATKLITARTINNVSFDGTENIVITDDTKEPIISSGTAIQYWDGNKSWQNFATTVRETTLSGLTTETNTSITDTDNVLVALGKLQSQVNIKINPESPIFTGTPTAPTAVAGTNTAQIATTAFVNSTVSETVNEAISNLNIDGGTF